MAHFVLKTNEPKGANMFFKYVLHSKLFPADSKPVRYIACLVLFFECNTKLVLLVSTVMLLSKSFKKSLSYRVNNWKRTEVLYWYVTGISKRNLNTQSNAQRSTVRATATYIHIYTYKYIIKTNILSSNIHIRSYIIRIKNTVDTRICSQISYYTTTTTGNTTV